MEKKTRICVNKEIVTIETLAEDNKWKVYASFKTARIHGEGLVVNMDMLDALQELSDNNYSLIWDK